MPAILDRRIFVSKSGIEDSKDAEGLGIVRLGVDKACHARSRLFASRPRRGFVAPCLRKNCLTPQPRKWKALMPASVRAESAKRSLRGRVIAFTKGQKEPLIRDLSSPIRICANER